MDRDKLNEFRNNALLFLFNIEILEDNTYVYDKNLVQGGLEYEDLEFQDINTVFTVDNFTVLQFDKPLRKNGILIINFNGIYMDSYEKSELFYREKYNKIIENNDNVKLINYIPLRTVSKENFMNLFERTEFNGIVTFDYIINKLYEIYIKNVIDEIDPEKIIIMDKELIKPLKNILNDVEVLENNQ